MRKDLLQDFVRLYQDSLARFCQDFRGPGVVGFSRAWLVAMRLTALLWISGLRLT